MSDDHKFKDHEEFFKLLGDGYIHPTSYGESIWDVSLEEIYQHFKARMEQEARDAAHPNPDCPARSGVSKSCCC